MQWAVLYNTYTYRKGQCMHKVNFMYCQPTGFDVRIHTLVCDGCWYPMPWCGTWAIHNRRHAVTVRQLQVRLVQFSSVQLVMHIFLHKLRSCASVEGVALCLLLQPSTALHISSGTLMCCIADSRPRLFTLSKAFLQSRKAMWSLVSLARRVPSMVQSEKGNYIGG